MKAIQTKHLGPTNHRPGRVKAFAYGGNSITIEYDYELSQEQAHRKAAEALVSKMDWVQHGRLIGGGISSGYVFVFENSTI